MERNSSALRRSAQAPVAQLDRVPVFGTGGWGFESLRAYRKAGQTNGLFRFRARRAMNPHEFAAITSEQTDKLLEEEPGFRVLPGVPGCWNGTLVASLNRNV